METEKESKISIEELPSYEETLALDWTLSADETRFILNSAKGDNPILYFAAQLKSLQNSGIFFNHENENALPEKIIHYLSKQLAIAANPLEQISRNSQASYRNKIIEYLDYQEYSTEQEAFLKKYIMHEMQNDLFLEPILKEKACYFLKSHKIMRPSTSILDRIIASFRNEALNLLYEKLASKLTTDQQSKILDMLKRQPNLLSQANYYKKSPPEARSLRINIFIKRFNELKEIGITQVDFSDVAESIFDKLELLGRTYDSSALSQLRSENKKISLLLCTLSSA